MDDIRSTASYELLSLVEKIRKGKTTKKQAEKALNELEKKYPDPYLPAAFEPAPKPWDKAYLEKLAGSVMYGKSSRAYILHIAEVADAVYRPVRILRAVFAAFFVMTAAAVCLFALLGPKGAVQ